MSPDNEGGRRLHPRSICGLCGRRKQRRRGGTRITRRHRTIEAVFVALEAADGGGCWGAELEGVVVLGAEEEGVAETGVRLSYLDLPRVLLEAHGVVSLAPVA